jgi:hypothetical protein
MYGILWWRCCRFCVSTFETAAERGGSWGVDSRGLEGMRVYVCVIIIGFKHVAI